MLSKARGISRYPERKERADKAVSFQNSAPVRHQVRHPETVGSKITTHFWMAQTTPEKHCLLSLLLQACQEYIWERLRRNFSV